MDRRTLLGTIPLLLAGAPLFAFAEARTAGDFTGTCRLAMASDGQRTRDDLDEFLTLRLVAYVLEIEYRITDRFGTRDLSLRAPLDGTPLVQVAQSRRAVLTARMAGEQLVLEIERDAPFGYIRNRRTMQLSGDQCRIESRRENLRASGAPHSAWQETWIRTG